MFTKDQIQNQRINVYRIVGVCQREKLFMYKKYAQEDMEENASNEVQKDK